MPDDSFWQQHKDLKPYLKQVEQLVNDSVSISDPIICKRVQQQLAGGKLIRPAFVLHFSQLTAEPFSQKAQRLAASIELLHNATLIHDDVIDESKERRHLATLQTDFGNDVAIYAGDSLFVAIFKILAETNDQTVEQLFADNLDHILNGELVQRQHRYDTELTLPIYLEIIQGKTAALFGLAAQLGIRGGLTDDPNLEKLAYQIGEQIGMAFQMLDDYLDYSGQHNKVGKPLHHDLARGVYTAPFLYAKTQTDFSQALADHDFDAVLDAIKESDALAQTKALSLEYSQRADQLIDQLPDRKITQQTHQLVDTLLNRFK